MPLLAPVISVMVMRTTLGTATGGKQSSAETGDRQDPLYRPRSALAWPGE
ncbi:hypothetical protein Ato02nite_068240 [Paractinoplanes toevensis]|uniref:Uncharacterized protein n=1 Tax=Paractinoplanes toevensis TaxID=571911 RepID=A0A919W8Q1_9ACTN|nr:hypothetical protein Ato02nite_068240 [Actinoplanes toevensis]